MRSRTRRAWCALGPQRGRSPAASAHPAHGRFPRAVVGGSARPGRSEGSRHDCPARRGQQRASACRCSGCPSDTDRHPDESQVFFHTTDSPAFARILRPSQALLRKSYIIKDRNLLDHSMCKVPHEYRAHKGILGATEKIENETIVLKPQCSVSQLMPWLSELTPSKQAGK